MNKISVNLDDQSVYSFDCKEVYDAQEFVSVFESHLYKIKKLANSGHAARSRTRFETNPLFDEFSLKIQALSGLEMKDHKTMRSFEFEKRVKGGQGFVWLTPRGKALWVYFRKGDLRSFDTEKKVIKDGSTWGKYPMMKINDQDELEYACQVARKIYETVL